MSKLISFSSGGVDMFGYHFGYHSETSLKFKIGLMFHIGSDVYIWVCLLFWSVQIYVKPIDGTIK